MFTPVGKFETWAEINLDNMAHNVRLLKELFGNSEIMAVLKANAYGLYAPVIFRRLLESGVRFFAVANVREALQLRGVDAGASILVLGNVHPRFFEKAFQNKLTLTVFSPEFWNILKQHLSSPLTVHIKLNTGFNRLGFSCDKESICLIKEICTHPLIKAEGIFTHLSLASAEDDMAQFEKFTSMVSALEAEGLEFPFKHVTNSNAAIVYPWSRLNLVRVADLIYGLKAKGPGYEKLDLRGVLKLKSSVSQVRTVPKGSGVSYDYAYRAGEAIRTATLAFGYADGYPRNLGLGKGFVIIRGQKAPLIGIMCMDQCVADVSNIPDVQINDEVLVFETDESSPVSAAVVAGLSGTIKSALFSSLAARVPRIYINDKRSFSLDVLNGSVEEFGEL